MNENNDTEQYHEAKPKTNRFSERQMNDIPAERAGNTPNGSTAISNLQWQVYGSERFDNL